jgi:hypothetical protein
MKAPPVLLLTLVLAGCASAGGILGEAPARIDGLEGNYRQIAACTYAQLARQHGQLARSEQQGVVRIALMNGSQKSWELAVIDDDQGRQSRLEFSSPNGYGQSEAIFAVARACAA